MPITTIAVTTTTVITYLINCHLYPFLLLLSLPLLSSPD